MPAQDALPIPDYAALEDAELVNLAVRRYQGAFRELMQRSNQRLFRIARGVLDDDAEAEDVMQEAYMHAFAHLDTFRAESSVLTWMTRIVLNEAYGRLRRRKPEVGVENIDVAISGGTTVIPFPARFGTEDPAARAARSEIRQLIEQAVGKLPDPFRLVFILREIEECTTEETARTLGIRAETVKTRLHRARRLLRVAMQDTLRGNLGEAFPFMGVRCERMTEAVLARLVLLHPFASHGQRPDND